MPYSLELNDFNSEMLEALAKKRNVRVSELIEKAVISYLISETLDTGNSPITDEAKPALGPRGLSGIKDFYTWDEGKGVIVFAPTKGRVFFMNAHSWVAIEQDLLAKYSKGAEHLLSEMGRAYGRAAAIDYRSVTDSPEKLESYFMHLGLIVGWGKFSISGDLAGRSKATLTVRDCVFCRSRNTGGERNVPCYFLTGVCKGIADTIFDSLHTVEETKCCVRGDEFCEISIWKSRSSEGAWPPGPNPMTGTPSR